MKKQLENVWGIKYNGVPKTSFFPVQTLQSDQLIPWEISRGWYAQFNISLCNQISPEIFILLVTFPIPFQKFFLFRLFIDKRIILFYVDKCRYPVVHGMTLINNLIRHPFPKPPEQFLTFNSFGFSQLSCLWIPIPFFSSLYLRDFFVLGCLVQGRGWSRLDSPPGCCWYFSSHMLHGYCTPPP